MKVELVRTFYAEAAHRNAEGGPAQQRLHGHSYRVDVVVRGEATSPYGWLMDYGELKQRFAPIYAAIDHRYLNDSLGLDAPTLPRVRAWIAARAAEAIPLFAEVRVGIAGDLTFTPTPLAAEPEQGLPARTRFTFEAAQSLPQLPEAHHCHNLHGHSYRMEVGATDAERLAPALRALYEAVDHTCLNDIPGLMGTTCEHLCAWVWARLEEDGVQPTVTVVQETQASRCVYRGG